jgi:ligand-binding sensor domain-containing protein
MKKIFFLFLIFSLAFSQNETLKVSEWKNYTSLLKINSLTLSNEYIWGATDGGIFKYSLSDNSIERFTNVDGLSNLENTAIFYDTKGNIWVGSSDGSVDVYNYQKKNWINIKDIALSYSSLSKNINGFNQKNDSIFIISDLGISIYNTSLKEFQDSYIKFGSFPAFTKTIDLTFDSKNIYVLTTSGLAVADINNKNLLSPDEWMSYSKLGYFDNQNLVDIDLFNNFLYILTDYGIYKYNNKSITRITSFNQSAKKIFKTTDGLYIVLEYQILLLKSNDIIETLPIQIPLSINQFILANNKIYLSLKNNGLWVINNNKPERIDLNCPYSNNFGQMIVASDGTLWVASSGVGGGGASGFYKFKDGVWTNYNVSTNPEIGTDTWDAVCEANDKSIFLGSYGSGVLKIKNNKFSFYNNTNSTLYGAAGNPSFIPITGIAKDANGTLWFTNYKADNNKPLSSFTTDSVWKNYVNGVNINSTYFFRGLVIDDYYTKWIISEYDPIYNGLFYFNEKYSLPGTVNGWGFIGNDEIYGSGTQVKCIAIDKNNELWIGTTGGVAVINKVSNPANSISRPCNTTRCNISGQVINCITVDPLNNKWVGTKTSGVWVLTPDGSSVIAQFNTTNSKIASDNITSISIDGQKGIVYIGTEKGLSSFKTFLVEPLQTFKENLKVYPNPYNPEKSTLSIDGLVESSRIKIITPYGKIIKDFQTPGGRVAYWNGTDENNEYVSSGIYFIISYTSDGSQSSIGKVAIVRSK